jgi:hypothetical protein
MSLEKSLERIADALEKIVEVQNSTAKRITETVAKAAEKKAPEDAPEAEEPQGEGKPDREYLKQQLDAKGISYNKRASTETLQKKLQDVTKEQTAKAVAQAEIPVPESQPEPQPESVEETVQVEATPVPEVSQEEAKSILIAFVEKNGTDKAKAILKDLKVKKISDLDAEGRAALKEKCNA